MDARNEENSDQGAEQRPCDLKMRAELGIT
jgi:hypothetical protein